MAEPVEDDIGLQRTFWRIQRLGWACMAAIVAAAVVGVFGDGRLAEASIRAGDVSMAYERIQRAGRETRILVHNAGAAPVLASLAGPAVATLDLADQPATGFEPLAEDIPENGPDVLRVRITAASARAFSQRALRILGQGRPPCPLCGLPLDTEGHICPRQNGHRAANG